MPQQRGCRGDKVLPIHCKCRMQQHHNPIRAPPSSHFQALWGPGADSSAGGSRGHGAGAEEGSEQGKTSIPRAANPNSPGSDVSPEPGGVQEPSAGLGGTTGGRKDAAIRPGLGHCQHG